MSAVWWLLVPWTLLVFAAGLLLGSWAVRSGRRDRDLFDVPASGAQVIETSGLPDEYEPPSASLDAAASLGSDPWFRRTDPWFRRGYALYRRGLSLRLATDLILAGDAKTFARCEALTTVELVALNDLDLGGGSREGDTNDREP